MKKPVGWKVMGRSAVITDTDDKPSATQDADAHTACSVAVVAAHTACSDPVAAVAAHTACSDPVAAVVAHTACSDPVGAVAAQLDIAEPEVAPAVEITTVGSRVYTASADCIPDGFVLASKTGVAVASGPMKGWFLLKKQR